MDVDAKSAKMGFLAGMARRRDVAKMAITLPRVCLVQMVQIMKMSPPGQDCQNMTILVKIDTMAF